MKSNEVIGIKPAAVRAWLNLSSMLDQLDENRRPPVCRHDPDAFTSDDRAERAAAAEACVLSACPALEVCRGFCLANDERWGVWAGVDVSNSKQRAALREGTA